ncbi:hypothetical protein GYMLUDRAFT_324930 [Collybiopsis luxurians FD-317 M1]|nr:hypothetical protein GYMLUDRAFT_324930 [Collybiopsis luxurians FD-317 M1]
MVLSIADRAKMRQRGNNSSSYPATPEIIELSDDDDELALRPTRKPRAKAKSKPAQTEPESSLPVATSPISIHHPVLPPSDPPQSTPDEFGLPPIAILPNPASSITSLPRTDDLDLDEEMPPAFFAPDTSPPNTHVPTTTGALHMDSVLMPPPVAPDVPKTAKKTHSRKKNNDDEGDEDEFVPGREGKQKTKKTRGKGKDKAQVMY